VTVEDQDEDLGCAQEVKTLFEVLASSIVVGDSQNTLSVNGDNPSAAPVGVESTERGERILELITDERGEATETREPRGGKLGERKLSGDILDSKEEGVGRPGEESKKKSEQCAIPAGSSAG
jgi:hypothetical protein